MRRWDDDQVADFPDEYRKWCDEQLQRVVEEQRVSDEMNKKHQEEMVRLEKERSKE